MMYQCIFQTDFGHAGICYLKNPLSISKIALPCPSPGILSEKLGEGVDDHAVPPPITILAESTRIYFQIGKPVPPPWGLFDMRPLTVLQQTVLKTVAAIPVGEVRSYGEVAAAVGKPKAARFVGNTMANNPFPIVIPCHRVVRSDGSVGQFGGGSDMKKKMLALEAAYVSQPR